MADIGGHCETSRLTSFETPWGLTVTVNKAVLDRFEAACEKAEVKNKRRAQKGRKTWRPKRIDSYNCRQIRGSSSWSRHAYGCAWDFFDKPYPQSVDVWGPTNAPPAWFRRCFTDLGFTAGASWISRKDYPHIEWSGSTAEPLPKPKRWLLKATKGEHTREVKKGSWSKARSWAWKKAKNGWRVVLRRR